MRLMALAGVIALQPFVLAQGRPKPAPPDPLAISAEEGSKVLARLWEAVSTEYFDPTFNGVDWARMKERYRPRVEAVTNKSRLRDVLQQMLDEIHTSHLRVAVRVKIDSKRIEQDLSRDVRRNERYRFDPGLRLARVEGQWGVETVTEGSGAQRAGVQRGWILTHWNGEPYRQDLPAGCDLGEKVNLAFIDLQTQQRRLDVPCTLYSVPRNGPERVSRVLESGARYVRFTEFASGTSEWLASQVATSGSAPAIIIDLRGNEGGSLSVLRRCFEPFFSASTVFGQFRDRRGKEPPLKVSGRGQNAYRGRGLVLIDEMSGSAAEIFGAGLQESGRAIVIGRPSMGAVLGSVARGLPNGFTVRIAVRDYQTAKGVRLEGRGVIPDEPVALTMRDWLAHRDADLERAQALLRDRRNRPPGFPLSLAAN
jgi:carboxyl-terminal processing protease